MALKSLFKPGELTGPSGNHAIGRNGIRRGSILLTAALSGAGAQRTVTFVPETEC